MTRPRPSRARIPWAIQLCLFCLLAAACEEPFEPIQQSDYVFSIYGHLEATADTQWVRVTSIRTALESFPEPIDAVVTLEEIETGTTVVMNDSLVHYRSVNFDEEVYAHNFSTTMPMVPGRHYRLTATRSDGASATVTVLIPVIEDPVMVVSSHLRRQPRGSIRGMRHIGMVLARQDLRSPCPLSWTVHQEYLRVFWHGDGDGEPHVALLEWAEEGGTPTELRPVYVPRPPPPPCSPLVGPRTILVVASGEEWLYGETTNLRDRSHPSAVNTIAGDGVGFLAGVNTHVFPYDTCVPVTGTNECTITFSERSATVVGFVTDHCDGRPVAASVTLRGPPAGGVRTTTMEGPGRFRFQGLDPGVPYTLSLAAGVNYGTLESEPLTFAEAAVDSVAFVMVDERFVDERGVLVCPP